MVPATRNLQVLIVAVVFLGYVGAEGESGQQNANDDQTSSSSGSSPSTPATATKEPEFYDHVNRFVRTNYANFTDEQKSELITFTESLQNEITLNTSRILGFGETFPDDLHANVSVQLRQGSLNQEKLDEVAELSHKARKRYIMFAIENLNATADKLGVSPFDFCHETGKDCSHLERSAANSNSGTAQDSGDANGVGSEEADSTESQAPQLNFSTLQSITNLGNSTTTTTAEAPANSSEEGSDPESTTAGSEEGGQTEASKDEKSSAITSTSIVFGTLIIAVSAVMIA